MPTPYPCSSKATQSLSHVSPWSLILKWQQRVTRPLKKIWSLKEKSKEKVTKRKVTFSGHWLQRTEENSKDANKEQRNPKASNWCLQREKIGPIKQITILEKRKPSSIPLLSESKSLRAYEALCDVPRWPPISLTPFSPRSHKKTCALAVPSAWNALHPIQPRGSLPRLLFYSNVTFSMSPIYLTKGLEASSKIQTFRKRKSEGEKIRHV